MKVGLLSYAPMVLGRDILTHTGGDVNDVLGPLVQV